MEGLRGSEGNRNKWITTETMQRMGAKEKQGNVWQQGYCNETSRMAHIGGISSQQHDMWQGGCKNHNGGGGRRKYSGRGRENGNDENTGDRETR